MNKPKPTSLRQKVVQALSELAFLSYDNELDGEHIKAVSSVIEKNTKPVVGFLAADISLKKLKTIALLKLQFGLTNKQIRPLIENPLADYGDLITKKKREVEWFAQIYAMALPGFTVLEQLFKSGINIWDRDLHADLSNAQGAASFIQHRAYVPLTWINELNDLRDSEAFQEGDPNTMCKVAERYLASGAIDIAEDLIEDILKTNPDHPGGYFQSARLKLRKASIAGRQSAHYQRLSDEADVMSAAEDHYWHLAAEEQGVSQDLKNQAFDACVTALGLFGDNKEYETEAIQWSLDYGTLRKLRGAILTFIVCEAGRQCDGYLPFDTQKNHPYPEDVGQIILAAYNELKSSHYSMGRNDGIMLVALNFLKFLAPGDEYKSAVLEFVERIKGMPSTRAGEFFGPFGNTDEAAGYWRYRLHEHLNCVLSKDDQRELIHSIYGKWKDDIDARRIEASMSIYRQEIRKAWRAGQKIECLQLAIKAERDGLIDRTQSEGALLLLRLAQHASQSSFINDGGDQPIKSELSTILDDVALHTMAESHFNDLETRCGDWDGWPYEDYLLPPAG